MGCPGRGTEAQRYRFPPAKTAMNVSIGRTHRLERPVSPRSARSTDIPREAKNPARDMREVHRSQRGTGGRSGKRFPPGAGRVPPPL